MEKNAGIWMTIAVVLVAAVVGIWWYSTGMAAGAFPQIS